MEGDEVSITPRTAAGDWRQITDDREKYKAYLCSREWALLRNAVRARCGGKCERCGVNEMECTHHLTYARKYDERLEDLAGWCNACHEFTHGKSAVDPAGKPELLFWETRDFFMSWAQGEAERGTPWGEMTTALVCALGAIGHMGLDWLQKAARGELKQKADVDVGRLEELIRKRRQEQGIQ
jgi:hypothetical protein